jgi:hypothetical protein
LGNPLKYTDPSGHDAIDALAFLAGILYGWGNANLSALGPLVPEPAREQYKALAVDSSAFQQGRVIGGLAAVAQGLTEAGAGGGMVLGGGLACTTGAGCVVGGGEAVVAGAAALVHGSSVVVAGATEAGQQLNIMFAAKTPAQIARGIRSLERQISQHEDKLARYRDNPDAHDNLGLLNNLPEAARRRIIEASIATLQREIAKFRNEIAKLQSQLESNGGP